MIDLKFTTPLMELFRDLVIRKVSTPLGLKPEERVAYLGRIKPLLEDGDVPQAVTLAKEIHGALIQGEILKSLWDKCPDPVWMVEKYMAAGGERHFRWDSEAKTIRPAPTGVESKEFAYMESFDAARRSAINRFLISLAGLLILTLLGSINLYAFVFRPSTTIVGVSVGAIVALSVLTLPLMLLRDALKDEIRFKAAHAFWCAWCSANRSDGEHAASDSGSGLVTSDPKPRHDLAIPNLLVTVLGVILICGSPFLPFLAKFGMWLIYGGVMSVLVLLLLRWEKVNATKKWSNVFWARRTFFIFTPVTLGTLGAFAPRTIHTPVGTSCIAHLMSFVIAWGLGGLLIVNGARWILAERSVSSLSDSSTE